MADKSNLARVLKRHENFWRRAPTKRPILGIPWWGEETHTTGLQLGPITPDKLDPEMFVTAYEESFEEHGLLEGDFFRVASALYLPRAEARTDRSLYYVAAPPFFIPWAELIFGCQAEVMSSAIWVKAQAEVEEKPVTPRSLGHNLWLSKVLDITKVLDLKFAGSYPTAPPMLRGPADMVAALLGAEKMCMDLIDDPGKVKKLLQMATDIWLEVNSVFRAVAAEFHRGYCTPRFQLWAPSNIVASQEDCSMFFSPARYNEFLNGINRRVLACSPYSIMHIHSGTGLHAIEPLINITQLGALEILLDETGPTPSELMPTFIKVQKEKPLILFRQFSKPEVEEILEHLHPEGLCINAVPGSSEDAIGLIQKLIEEDR